jgi:predicted enzyme related to lactoylglutathione lyase
MGNAVVHFEVSGKDGKKLQEFYKGLFDWKMDVDPNGYGMVEAGEGGIGGGVAASEQGPSVTFYVDVDDCQKYLDKAVSLGGKIISPPQDYGGMVTFALFSDPEGNIVGVAKTH